VGMSATTLLQAASQPKPPTVTPVYPGLVQRRCTCATGDDCKDCGGEDLGVQTSLAISRPGDRYEQEADRVAEHIMRTPTSAAVRDMSSAAPTISRWSGSAGTEPISRQAADGEQQEEEESSDPSVLLSISRKEASAATPAVTPDVAADVRALSGGGAPLGDETRAFFESRFGHDFRRVRVHTGLRAADTTRALNARAYTLGSDIAFAPGEYQPQSESGRFLLAHELTHVVQQRDGVQALMRACACSGTGERKPASSEHSFLSRFFPHLKSDAYCVTGPKTPTYNCYAFSAGITSRWVESEVDSSYGNKNGTLEFSDFDAFYATLGLVPVTNATPANPVVALYAKSGSPTHAARNTASSCGNFESKLGKYLKIAHVVSDLEGGSVYGDIDRYYVKQ
jgi:hypothetical protein